MARITEADVKKRKEIKNLQSSLRRLEELKGRYREKLKESGVTEKFSLKSAFTKLLKNVGLIEAVDYQLPGLQSGIDSDEYLWRRLTQTPRDMPLIVHERMQKLAYYMYLNNPMARAIIEMTKNFLIGEGVTAKAENEEVNKVIKRFWDDPDNAWDIYMDRRVTDLLWSGEWAFKTNVEKSLGLVKLGFIDPQQIKDVKVKPTNIEQYDKISLAILQEKKELKVVQRELQVKEGETGFGLLDGEILFFTINNVTASTRGVSELYCIIDWLDGFDSFLFSRLERAKLINTMIWDLKCTGMQQHEIKTFVDENFSTAPSPGSVRAHNEKIELNAIVPEFASGDVAGEIRTFRQQILTGVGFPETWFTEGRGTYKSVAQEISIPTMKKLQAKQKNLKYILEYILQYVVDQSVKAGQLNGVKEEERKPTVDIPKILEEDVSLVVSSLQVATSALDIGVQKGWVTNEQAQKVYLFLVNRTGLELKEATPEEIQKSLEELSKKQQMMMPQMPGGASSGVPVINLNAPIAAEVAKKTLESYIKAMEEAGQKLEEK